MRRCFVISPIGEAQTSIREHADDVFNYIVKPATEAVGILASRGDHFKEPGKITEQTFNAIVESEVCIAILTGHNPNVFYELAFAQAACKPIVALVSTGDSIPFDIHDMRCIRYDLRPRSIVEGVFSKELQEHLRSLDRIEWRNPPPFGGMLRIHPTFSALTLRHDVFIAHPMYAADSDEKYKTIRSLALSVSELLEANGHRCHVPGRSVESKEGLLDPGFAFKNSAQAIREAKYFLMLYPEPMVSTVLVEAGEAVALGKRAIYFVRSRSDLPYGLRQSESLDCVKIYECIDREGVLALFKNHGIRVFEPW
jgi:hypothetical protein